MVSEFQAYMTLGLRHITDPRAYDHLLFVVTLCAPYTTREWKRILLLVTAFTLGHSLTLAMAALAIISPPQAVIETLIPLTIIGTAFQNLLVNNPSQNRSRYLLVLIFGFIHGMGFSGYFKSLLGDSANIIYPLFAFNLGIEAGQLIIVGVVMLLSWFFLERMAINRRIWIAFISGGAATEGTLILLRMWFGI